MKVGIVTFQRAYNYGAVLQAYALCRSINTLGYPCEVIDYHCAKFEKDYRKVSIFNSKSLRSFVSAIVNGRVRNRKRKRFVDFVEKEIHLSNKQYYENNITEANEVYDIFITGSDQVWNYWYANVKRYKNPLHAYFLDFGSDGTKRLSYAASWGVTKLPEDFVQAAKPLLAKFNYLGVREESGVDLCRQCGREDAEWVCDPTLLLGAETYRNLYAENKIRKPEKNYILLYMLNNTCDFDIQSVYDFAAGRQLDVVYVTGNGVIDSRKKYFATIPEWLYLVDNAEYVITNSFHCGVFSTIFHKQFGIVPLSGKLIGMNARFDSLFELRGTGNRFVTDRDFSVLEKTYQVKPAKVSQNFLNVLQ
mgnify:CR=1 FL=1